MEVVIVKGVDHPPKCKLISARTSGGDAERGRCKSNQQNEQGYCVLDEGTDVALSGYKKEFACIGRYYGLSLLDY